MAMTDNPTYDLEINGNIGFAWDKTADVDYDNSDTHN